MSLEPKRIPGTDRDLEQARRHVAATRRRLDAELRALADGQARLDSAAEQHERLGRAPNRPEDLEGARRAFRKACNRVIGFCRLLGKGLRERKRPRLAPSPNGAERRGR